MATDKKISELPVSPGLSANDVSVIVKNGVDYQFSVGALLQYLSDNSLSGVGVTFGNVLPQNNTGKNGDVFVKTSTGQFAQKISGAWTIVYTLPESTGADGTLLYGAGSPGNSLGKNADTYIDTLTGIFYLKSSSGWSQVFSMQTGPQGPRGDKGDTGVAGLSGKSILSGPANPSNQLTGINGDFYINTNSYVIFGPKTAGSWGSGTSLVGQSGEQGEQGNAGPAGEKGDSGIGIAEGGTSGQILKKLSAEDYHTTWANNDFASITGSAADNVSLSSALSGKVDKQAGYTLSQENFTTSEKNKLATLSEHFRGRYTSLIALQTANLTGNSGDYATVDAGANEDTKLFMWDGDSSSWVMSSGSNAPGATEAVPGLIELATVAEALARTDDERAMTAFKTIALILDEKKKVSYQINPVGVNEVSILMEAAGKVNSILIAGASSAKLKIGQTGSYPTGTQTYPFTYGASDRVFITYTYSDLNQASCNIKLKCQDN